MLGRAPFRRATWSQKMADSEPVTARFGPRSSPSSRARGCAGSRADSSTAAGRLLIAIAVPAAIHAVAQRPVCASAVPIDVARASVPRPTATASSAASNNGLAASTARRTPSRPATAAASPSPSTGTAGRASTSTSTAAAAIATAPTPGRNGTRSTTRATGRDRSRRKTSATNTIVIATETLHAGARRAANVVPDTCSCARTIRFVRFAPGSSRDAEFAMNTAPYRNGPSASPRARAAWRSTGVRKTTAVSRFKTAVTRASTTSRPPSSATGPPGARATSAPASAKTPSRAATAPISSSPATSAKAGHACEKALAKERLRDGVPLGRHRLQLSSRLLERHRDDVVTAQRGHLPELPGLRELGRFQPVARREHAVARRRRAAALNVAQDRDPRLEAGPLLDLAAEQLADAALGQRRVTELVPLARVLEAGQLAAFADDDDREVLAARVAAADAVRDLVEVDGLLRDEDHVGAAGDAAHDGDPAGVAAHHLDDHHAVVRLGRRMQAVDRLGRDRHGGVEPERVVGAGEIVVDRLRDADDREAVLGVEARGDAERVLAADCDQRVEPAVGEVLQHLLDAPVQLERVRPSRADDRPAAGEDPRHLRRPEVDERPVDQAAPALEDADRVPAGRVRGAHHRPDHGIQPGAVATAREDPYRARHGGKSYPLHTKLAPLEGHVFSGSLRC